jgi:hypothetical protein
MICYFRPDWQAGASAQKLFANTVNEKFQNYKWQHVWGTSKLCHTLGPMRLNSVYIKSRLS